MLALTLATALAGPMEDIARTELNNARSIHQAVKSVAALDKVSLTAACTDAHAKAGEQVTMARAAMDAGDPWKAYAGVHEAMVLLQPCSTELVEGPRSFAAMVKAAMRTVDDQVASLKAHLGASPSEAAAKQLAAAEAAAKDTRAKALAGEHTEAVKAWYVALQAVHDGAAATR